MKIILLRHGKPDIKPCKYLTTGQLPGMVDTYNRAGIRPDQPPPPSAIKRAQSCNVVLCSDLKRSIDSARALGIDVKVLSDSVFREVGMPYPDWPPMILPPMIWATLLRLCQLLGYRRNGESLTTARRRADEASRKLIELAAGNQSVMLVGHGYMNRFIAKQLQASGWTGPKTPGHDFWECSVYRLDDD